MLVALIASLIPCQATHEARVSSVSGDVKYQLAQSNAFLPLKVNQKLTPGTTIKAGPNSNAIIVTVPGAGINIAENTTVTLAEIDFNQNSSEGAKRKTLVELRSGTVSALIDKNVSSQTDFRIKTPQGTATARGTFYGVTYDGKQTYVAVREGKVGVSQMTKKR